MKRIVRSGLKGLFRRCALGTVILSILFCFSLTSTALDQSERTVRFAVIGDYGKAGDSLRDVSNLIKSWNPEFIITTGDNNYPQGSASTVDENIGQYFHDFIYPYKGDYGAGAIRNLFFPSLGNHDWRSPGAAPYLAYFTLPGNERYYDFVWEPVHFLSLDSDDHEPDGNASHSVQANWLKNTMSTSRQRWKIVYMHYPPYSSGKHGPNSSLQWPFKEWGATVVIAGHDHTYERITHDEMTYFVNGLGGKSVYPFKELAPGSQLRYNDDYGAMLVEAHSDSIVFKFINRRKKLIDQHTIHCVPLPMKGN